MPFSSFLLSSWDGAKVLCKCQVNVTLGDPKALTRVNTLALAWMTFPPSPNIMTIHLFHPWEKSRWNTFLKIKKSQIELKSILQPSSNGEPMSHKELFIWKMCWWFKRPRHKYFEEPAFWIYKCNDNCILISKEPYKLSQEPYAMKTF